MKNIATFYCIGMAIAWTIIGIVKYSDLDHSLTRAQTWLAAAIVTSQL